MAAAKIGAAESAATAEILIADNSSTDGSQDIATANGARSIPVPERGYGAALQGGFAEAKGTFIIFLH
jgi:glycosyltransferase involved in cell wall biosynthesis